MGETPVSSEQSQRIAVDPWIGRVVDGRYRVEELLGEGGMGSVFIAEHLKLHKQVALKVIHTAFAGDGEVAARFAREAMASAQLDHPHVASALDFGTLPEGGAYLVMQLVRGRSIAKMIEQDGAVSWQKACAIGAQVADALAAAHAKGIVHRDLKPDNVLLEPRDDGSVLVKVLDFGIARVAALDDQRAPHGAELGKALTRIGTVIGTPGYMAPEQAMGEAVDARADLYALGVVLWEMVAGKSLFDTQELTAIVTRQLTEEMPALQVVAKDALVPDDLDSLVGALLKRAPADRPASASEVRERLRALAFGGSSMSLPTVSTTGKHATSEVGTAHTVLAGTGSTGRRSVVVVPTPLAQLVERARERPHVAVIGCGAVLALCLVVIVGAVGLSGDDDEVEPASGATVGSQPFGGIFSPVVEAVSEKPIPPEVQEKIDELLHAENRRERQRAARWLMHHEPEGDVPEWARVAAVLEAPRTRCEERRDAVLRLAELDDEEALPALERIDRSGRRGCGPFFARTDCHGCLRADLPDAIEALGGTPQASDE